MHKSFHAIHILPKDQIQQTIIEFFGIRFHFLLHSSVKVSSVSTIGLSVHKCGGFTKGTEPHQYFGSFFDGVVPVTISQTSESFTVGRI